MTEPICGKVAEVLNDREIAINIGSTNGVDIGMYFDVMYPESGEIRDPDTQEVLGSIARKKVRVQITEVREKWAVASTYRSEHVTPGLHLGPFARALMPPSWITKYETTKNTWESLDDERHHVKIGDPIIQVIEDKVGREKANS